MARFKGKTSGTDAYGNPVRLGDTDEMGYFVSYIDDDGSAWESLAERDRAIASSRYDEARIDWHDGYRRTRPSAWLYAVLYSKDRRPVALKETVKEIRVGNRWIERLQRSAGRI